MAKESQTAITALSANPIKQPSRCFGSSLSLPLSLSLSLSLSSP